MTVRKDARRVKGIYGYDLIVEYIEGRWLDGTMPTCLVIGGKGTQIEGKRRWIPDPGDQLFYLGGGDGEYGSVEYYLLRRSDGDDVYLQLDRDRHGWAFIRWVLADEVPEWVLAGLVFPTQDEGTE